MSARQGTVDVNDPMTAPSEDATVVVTSNSTVISRTRALWVGTGGDVKVTINGVDITFANVPDGTLLPIIVTKVFLTGTTASDIVALR